jgi:Family of unknown function (DUF5670)
MAGKEVKDVSTIFGIFLVMWVVSSDTLGGFIHILLITAAAILVINLIRARRLW